ncbi:general substrate transporter [Dipodascopsis uninucleata]
MEKRFNVGHEGDEIYKNIVQIDSHLKWYQNKGIRRLNLLILAIFIGQALNGYDGSLISSFQSYKSWVATVGHPSSSALGLINASVYISGFVTAPFAAFISDRFGRKWCIRYSALTNLIGTAIGCAAGAGKSHGYSMFIISRVIIGSGIAFAVMISPIMLQELPHPKQRTALAGFFDCAYNIGSFIAAWVCFGCSHIASNWSWRIPYLIHIGPALFMLIFIQFLPESPRWLMMHGKEEKCREFLVKYHANGHEDDPMVEFELNEIKEALLFEKNVKQDSWKNIFFKKGNRHRMGLVFLIGACQNLSGTGIIQYYYTKILNLVGITDSQTQTGINAGLTSWTWLCALLGLYLSQRIKRRQQLAISWIGTLLANIGLTIATARYEATGASAPGIAAVVMVWLYNGAFFIACGPLFFSYQVEVLTYTMRARGMMVWGLWVKSLSIFSAYTNPLAMERIGYKWYIFYTAIISLTGVLMYFFIVETKGYTLEEIAILFDGEPVQEALAHVTEGQTVYVDDEADSEKDHNVKETSKETV